MVAVRMLISGMATINSSRDCSALHEDLIVVGRVSCVAPVDGVIGFVAGDVGMIHSDMVAVC